MQSNEQITAWSDQQIQKERKNAFPTNGEIVMILLTLTQLVSFKTEQFVVKRSLRFVCSLA